MIHYRKLLELHAVGISSRGITVSTGNSHQKVTESVNLALKKGLIFPLEEVVASQQIEEFLFLEKTLESSGRQPRKFDSNGCLLFCALLASRSLPRTYVANSGSNLRKTGSFCPQCSSGTFPWL